MKTAKSFSRCTPKHTMTGCRTLGRCACPPQARPYRVTGFTLFDEQVKKLEVTVRRVQAQHPGIHISRSAVIRMMIDAFDLPHGDPA